MIEFMTVSIYVGFSLQRLMNKRLGLELNWILNKIYRPQAE